MRELGGGLRSGVVAGVVEIAADVVSDPLAVAAASLLPNYSRGGFSPRVAGGDRATRVGWLREAAAWLAEYRAALGRFVEGTRDVEFPRGTWAMGVRLGCRVAPG